MEYIEAPLSLDGSEGLLAIAVRASYAVPPGIQFHTDKDQPLQLATMGWAEGHVVPPHVHLRRERVADRTQEFMLVRSGRVYVSIFTSARELVRTVTLDAGDCILLLSGGHSMQADSDASILYVKTGPYTTREEDKVEWTNTSC